MSFAYAEQYHGTQPCDRPGAKYDRKAEKQELIDRSAKVAAEYDYVKSVRKDELHYMQADAWECVKRNYEDELLRIERLLDLLT